MEAALVEMVKPDSNVHGQVEFVDEGGCFGQEVGFGEELDEVTVLVVLHDHEAVGLERGGRVSGVGGLCGDAVELGEVVVAPATVHDLDLNKTICEVSIVAGKIKVRRKEW